MVQGASTTNLLVRWNPPADNAGRPDITDYDLQFRENGTSDAWRPWPHSGTETTTVISSGLQAGTQYEVQVLARNSEGASDWSEPGIGSTYATAGDPVFLESSPTRSFKENRGDAVTVTRMNVGDPVTATGEGSLTYSLEGIDEASFDIDSSTGQLKTKTGVTYDHETKSSYMVTVKASDASNASATIAVTINITDVDEPPLAPGTPDVIGASTTSLSVTWDPPTDNTGRPDITGYDVQYRQGIRGNWRDVPQEDVSGTSATITGLNEGTLYQIQVRAINNEGSGPYSQPGAGSTNMENPDNNNRAPEFGSEMTTRSFPENTPPNQSIGTPVEASDADVTDPNKDDTLTYSLSGTDAASFNIDFDTGQLRTRSGVTYDYETKNEYSVKVTVTDSSNDRDTIDVTINVTNVDEGGGGPVGNRRPTRSPSDEDGESTIDEKPPPVVNQEPTFPSPSATRSFAENTPPGRNVGAPVTATDAEGHTLTYILDGPDAASFDIDDSTGQIKTKSGVSYDYEVKFSYAVTVTATDPDNASASIPVTINVEDVDEKPGTPGAPTVSAPDGSRTSLLVSWTAPDLNGGPPLTGYELQYRPGTSGDWRPWPHSGTGTTTTITGLNAGTDYQVRVRALGELPSDWSPPGSGRTNNSITKGWLARFGRTLAQQMMESVEDRLASPCRTGLQGTLAGYGFGDERLLTPHGTGNRLAARDGSGGTPPYWAGGDLEAEGGSVTGPTLLAGTEFELGSETASSGIACVWGRGGHSSFHGREGSFSLDGNVTTGTLGADYAKGPWTVGLALSHSRGEGRSSKDDIEAALTGLYPYAGYKITERFSVWGLGGFGRGGLTVTPDSGTSMETDMSLLMIAAGARSLILTAAHGMNVAFETDGFWVHAASDAAPGLLASKADANRLRLGLESSYRVVLKNGGTLTPKFEIGWRYDGGGAETGLGMDVGGGLLWSAPVSGISAEIVVRRVLMHEATGFNDWSVSGLVRYDPNPSSERGAALALRSSIGPPSLDGANALLERETMAKHVGAQPRRQRAVQCGSRLRIPDSGRSLYRRTLGRDGITRKRARLPGWLPDQPCRAVRLAYAGWH